MMIFVKQNVNFGENEMDNQLMTLEPLEIVESQFPPLSLVVNGFILSLDCKSNSINTYRRSLNEFVQWINFSGKPMELNLWTRQDILDYKRYLQSPDRGITSNTSASYLMIVCKLWDWLEQENISENITKGIKGIRRPDNFRKDMLTIAQIKDALNTFDLNTLEGMRNYAMFNLMVRTGCRDIEIARAKIRNLRTVEGEKILEIHSKGHETADQLKVLTAETERPIRKYLDARRKIRLFENDDFLFVSLSSRNYLHGMTTRSISRIVKNALREIGLDDKKLSAHSLRHTAISLAIAGGASLHDAQAMAGHKDPRTTQRYFHNQNRISKAAEKCINF